MDRRFQSCFNIFHESFIFLAVYACQRNKATYDRAYPLVGIDINISQNDLDVLVASLIGTLAADRRIRPLHVNNANQRDAVVEDVITARSLKHSSQPVGRLLAERVQVTAAFVDVTAAVE